MSFHHELTEVLELPELWPKELDFIKEFRYVQIAPGKVSKSGVPKPKTQVNQRTKAIKKAESKKSALAKATGSKSKTTKGTTSKRSTKK